MKHNSKNAANINAAIAGLIALLDAQRNELIELHVQKASLEDVFFELTEEGAR